MVLKIAGQPENKASSPRSALRRRAFMADRFNATLPDELKWGRVVDKAGLKQK